MTSRSTALRATLALTAGLVVSLGACTVERAPEPDPTKNGLVIPPRDRTPKPPGNGTNGVVDASPLAPEQEARRLAAIDKLRAGDVAGGRDALRALVDEAGPSYALYNDQAVAAGMDDNWTDSLAFADKALAISPQGLEATTNRIEAMIALGDRTGALDAAEALVRRRPESAAAHVALGSAYLSLMRLGDARGEYEAALDRAPDDVVAATGVLAVAAYDLNAVEVDELAEKLAARLPDDPYVLHLSAVARERRNDAKGAVALYERAIAAAEKRPPSQRGPVAWSHYNLGLLLESERKPEAALPHFEAFIKLAPPSAQLEREDIQKKLDREKKTRP